MGSAIRIIPSETRNLYRLSYCSLSISVVPYFSSFYTLTRISLSPVKEPLSIAGVYKPRIMVAPLVIVLFGDLSSLQPGSGLLPVTEHLMQSGAASLFFRTLTFKQTSPGSSAPYRDISVSSPTGDGKSEFVDNAISSTPIDCCL